MVTVADEASKKIRTMLEDQGQPDYGLRLAVVGGGCSGLQYKLEFVDRAGEADRVIESNGVKVFVDPTALMYLIGAEMDYRESKFESGFVFNNPNETDRCGCGESFRI